MEIFLLFILLLVVIWLAIRINDRLTTMESNLRSLRDIMLRKQNETQAPPKTEQVEQKPEPVTPTPSKYTYIPPQPLGEYKPEPKKEEIKEELHEENIPSFIKTEFNEPPLPPEKPYTFKPAREPQPVKPGFFERNPDLEKFIGENLVNKIGIAVLVLGIGFFVKYAIDQNWINALGRVGIGILCGGILLGVAHYLRKRFKAFSSVLVGGGLAVLYFTIAIAFHQYQLIDQTAAFIIMVVITTFAVLLSIAYDRLEIAVLSIIGGFSTPFIVSTGEGNYVVLFTYLMILNVGMLVLAYFKKWNLINILAYAFTILIYGGWLIATLGFYSNHYLGALVFGSLFYVTFFLMHIINNVKEKRVFNGLDFALLISNTALYYAAGMYILHYIDAGYYEGLFTVALAVFNFVFAFVLYKKQSIDRNLVFLLIGLVLSFASLAAPVQLHGHHITLFWSAEAVLLLWLSQRSGIRLMKVTSVIITGLMLISLCMDWYKIYYNDILYTDNSYTPFTIAFNKGFITGLISVVSLMLSAFFIKKEKEEAMYTWFDFKIYRYVLMVLSVITLYLTVLFELYYQLNQRLESASACQVVLGFYNMLFAIAVNVFAMRKKNFILSNICIVFNALLLFLFISYYNNEAISLRNSYLLGTGGTFGMYLFHYLTTLSAIALLVISFIHSKRIHNLQHDIGVIQQWYTAFIGIYILSAELCHLMIVGGYTGYGSIATSMSQATKIGFPVLWGVCSLVLMVLGMRLKMRHLRIISLSLFFITLVKLFLFDIREVSEGGKIVAFISLGILLLVVSFMYQKLKVLILEDNKGNKQEDKNEE